MTQTLETATPLRDSLIWEWNRHYYARTGQAAWTTNIVPSFVTTNAMTAAMSARILHGALRDIAARHGESEPILIVELGGGTGRFAHHCLLQLLELARASPYPLPPFRYLLTDAFDRNVTAWECRAPLARWRKSGLLELGVFDVETDHLISVRDGPDLGPGSCRLPLLIVSHYVFDATRQDAFRIEDGSCLQGHTTLRSAWEAEPEDPTHLQHFEVDWTFGPATAEACYPDDPSWPAVLRHYADSLEGTHVTIPWAAARCLDRLTALSTAGAVALVSDKGFDRLAQLRGQGPPGFQIHGSMSMGVNLDALARRTAASGGMALRTDERGSHRVVALGLGISAAELPHTRSAFLAAADQFGPSDLLRVKEVSNRARPRASLPHLLGLLRLCCWDPEMFYRVHRRLLECVPQADAGQRRELTALVGRVAGRFLPIEDDRDVYFALGLLDSALGNHARADRLFTRSIESFGVCAASLYNRALCNLQLEHSSDAIQLLRKAIELDPAHEGARGLLEQARASIADSVATAGRPSQIGAECPSADPSGA